MKNIKIFGEHLIDVNAVAQFHTALEAEDVVQAALMPDAHKGYSLPIGAVVATTDKVYPSWVGFDIGCSVASTKTQWCASQLNERTAIFDAINRAVPTGFSHRSHVPVCDAFDAALSQIPEPETAVSRKVWEANGNLQLGTLGGGNHFIEIGTDVDGHIWISVHSGSRGIGHAVASHYMKAAADGHAREGNFGVLATSELGQQYLRDHDFCIRFALQNRRTILNMVVDQISRIVDGVPGTLVSHVIDHNHNHCEVVNGRYIHRKGATQATYNAFGAIPANMRDGVFIVRGLGCAASMSSSSHGAGRLFGRKEAGRMLNMDTFTQQMAGITAAIGPALLDESPGAYKDIGPVLHAQQECVEVVHHIRPIINMKAH